MLMGFFSFFSFFSPDDLVEYYLSTVEVPADKDMSDDEDADNPDVRVNRKYRLGFLW